jgi:[ribosomal protein S18]-alanine N-acetyltransferase
MMQVRPLTRDDADAIATWRYPEPYSTYDVAEVITAARGFWSVFRDEELVGYCCFGYEARVPGVDEEEDTIDVGYGMRPDLMGRGSGHAFVSAICNFAVSTFSPLRLRVLVLDWNRRSRKVAEDTGFEIQGSVPSEEGEFVVLVRKLT